MIFISLAWAILLYGVWFMVVRMKPSRIGYAVWIIMVWVAMAVVWWNPWIRAQGTPLPTHTLIVLSFSITATVAATVARVRAHRREIEKG